MKKEGEKWRVGIEERERMEEEAWLCISLVVIKKTSVVCVERQLTLKKKNCYLPHCF